MKRLLFVLLLLLGATATHAQTAVETWVQRYNWPGDGNNAPAAIAVDTNGNVFVTGGAGSLQAGNHYATIAYSATGVPLWTNLYIGPGNNSDNALAIAVDSIGSVLVTGRSTSSNGDNDYATIKYSNAGVPLWTNRYNGPAAYTDQPAAIAVYSNGDVFVTGFSFGDSSDYATIKYSGAGVPLWTNRYDGPGNNNDRATAIALDANENVFVTGSSAEDTSIPYYWHYATIAYSSEGVALWTNRYLAPGKNIAQSTAIAVDGNGNVLVTGYSYTLGLPDFDYATIKYSGAGMMLWTNSYDGPANNGDYANALAVDSSGNVIVTGYSVGSGTGNDYATIKYSTEGVPLWTNRYSGPANASDVATAIALDGSGNVFVTGYSPGNGYDIVTVSYSSAGVSLWTNRYNGPGNYDDKAIGIVADGNGNVFVIGNSARLNFFPYNYDYATIKYSVVQPIPLAIQLADNQVVLSWSNAAFGLQTAATVTDVFTNILGATSPYTNATTGPQQFFRLKAN